MTIVDKITNAFIIFVIFTRETTYLFQQSLCKTRTWSRCRARSQLANLLQPVI